MEKYKPQFSRERWGFFIHFMRNTMAVLVEAISVIVRMDTISSKYHGGWDAFIDDVPNGTLCFDGEIARVGFMAPTDVKAFRKDLERKGLQFLDNGKSIDIAVVDQ